eukprot:1179328-Prorocentrum_minimum.AAC.3
MAVKDRGSGVGGGPVTGSGVGSVSSARHSPRDVHKEFPSLQHVFQGLQSIRLEEKGTPVEVVYRARGPALGAGRTSLPRPTSCFWASALNLGPPLPYRGRTTKICSPARLPYTA